MTCIPNSAPRRAATRSRVAGFTLIEIMIVVLIIGVLMAIAYPSYQNNVIRSRRATAAGCLLETAQFMERYYTSNLTYVGAAVPPLQCRTDLAAFYTIGLDGAVAAKTYKVQAVPRGIQVKDTECSTLKINQSGAKEKTGTASSASACF